MNGNDYINPDFSRDDVRNVVGKTKYNKAVDFDSIPNEVSKNDICIDLLHVLFQTIFTTGNVPSQWKMAILNPIQKSSHIDTKIPM